MEAITPSVNWVMYLLVGHNSKLKKNGYFLGGHGYSYDIQQEGKRKLTKDVPTSAGYYTGNPQKTNTAVTIRDIVSLTVVNAESEMEALLKGYWEVLNALTTDPILKNLCVITEHKVLEALSKVDKKNVEDTEEFKLGRLVLSATERAVLLDVLTCLEIASQTDRRVVFDFPGVAEGGQGNKEASKQRDLAETISLFGFKKETNLEVVSRKEYENPEVEFNKIVSASRWYFNTLDPEAFYKEQHGYRVYGFGKVERDKTYYGKLTPDVTYSKLYTKQPLRLLDKLFDFTVQRIANPEGYLSAGDLNHIVTKDVARLVDHFPGVPKEKELISPFTKQNTKPVLIELISPVLMSYRIRDFLIGMDILFEGFMNKDTENRYGYLTFYIITDLIYQKEVNGKGVEKLKLDPAFTQTRETISLKVTHPSAIKPVTIKLSIGYDTPDRNAFNSITDPKVKVWCVTDTRNKEGLRYATIVETDEFIYVHTSAIANLRVLTLAELGRSTDKE